jgi:murein DD-endopeptidase MepM/ murein hydrolase activator NlpD
MYAHLDSFSPSIKIGKKIKKGTVIGRVSNKLYFEVMENNYRINPLDVIK